MFGVHKQINTVIEWIHLLVPLDGLCFFGYLYTVFKMSIISTDTNKLDGFKADIKTFTQYKIKHRSYPFGKLITAIFLIKKALSQRNGLTVHLAGILTMLGIIIKTIKISFPLWINEYKYNKIKIFKKTV